MDWKNEFERGLKAHQSGDFGTALACYREAHRKNDSVSDPLKAMAVVYAQTGDLESGIGVMEQVAQKNPTDGENLANLCFAYLQVDKNADAVRVGQKAIEFAPESAFCHNNLSAALRLERDYDQAFDHARRALELQPGMGEATINASACLMAVGEIDSANALLADLVQREPKNWQAWDNYLFGLHYSESISAVEIREVHELYGSLFPERPRPVMREKPKTIGFVSGDMNRHPVGYFLRNVFAGLRSRGWRVVAFSNRIAEDDLSDQLKGDCTAWHSVSRLSDEDLAQLIRKEEVDVLIDLSGHTAKNRLPVFALRPAAIQATYLGYSSTTGLSQMDFLIADEATVPEGQESGYVEQIVRMNRSLYCMPVKSPEPKAIGNKQLVFGSFNNPYKLSRSNLVAFAQILERVPESSLVMKYATFDSEAVKSAFTDRLKSTGVDMVRVKFYGHLPYDEHLEVVSSVDIALDSFPYTGATTTVDAVKSGTPTVTLAGDRYSARMSASVLMAFDLEELVAKDSAEYVELAVRLSSDLKWREEILSKLCDPKRLERFSDSEDFAKSFEDAVFNMWSQVSAIKT